MAKHTDTSVDENDKFYVIVGDDWRGKDRLDGLRAAQVTARRHAELGRQVKIVKAISEYEPHYAVKETHF